MDHLTSISWFDNATANTFRGAVGTFPCVVGIVAGRGVIVEDRRVLVNVGMTAPGKTTCLLDCFLILVA